MAFTPRTAEIRAVVDVLTSTEYPDESVMAKAIVRAVAAELVKRELFIIVPERSPIGWGPYWTRTEAEAHWRKQIGATVGDTRAGLLHAFPWSPPAEVDSTKHVCSCGHHRNNHVMARRRTTETYRDCAFGRCPCDRYTEDGV